MPTPDEDAACAFQRISEMTHQELERLRQLALEHYAAARTASEHHMAATYLGLVNHHLKGEETEPVAPGPRAPRRRGGLMPVTERLRPGMRISHWDSGARGHPEAQIAKVIRARGLRVYVERAGLLYFIPRQDVIRVLPAERGD